MAAIGGGFAGGIGYIGGKVLTNWAQGKDLLVDLDVGDLLIATGAGALTGLMASTGYGFGAQLVMNGIIGFDASLGSMALHGSRSRCDLILGTAVGMTGAVNWGEGVQGFLRGLLSGSLFNAGQNLAGQNSTNVKSNVLSQCP